MSVRKQFIRRARVRLAIAATFPAHTTAPDNHDAESCAHHVPESRQDPEFRQDPSAVGATPAGAAGIAAVATPPGTSDSSSEVSADHFGSNSLGGLAHSVCELSDFTTEDDV